MLGSPSLPCDDLVGDRRRWQGSASACGRLAGLPGEDAELHWEWAEDVDWEPKVRMTMSSETANKYFQGKENVPIAIARRRIKTGGDVKSALKLIPITKPVYARYRDMVERDYPHLAV